MKPGFFNERGQALVIITLAAIGLFGAVGLAIDGGAKFSDRRHAQNAADTAATAGALALARGQSGWALAARNRAGSNGYLGDLQRSQVWVYKCNDPARHDSAPLDCGPYENNGNYLEVIIQSHVNTFFARVIGINQTHNLVQAVAFVQTEGPAFPGYTFVEYKPQGSGCPAEFIVGGSGTVTVDGGGIYVNSNNTGGGGSNNCEAFTQSGCNTTLNMINGGIISTVGGIALQGTCAEKIVAPQMTEGVDPLPFPPDIVLDPPPECNDLGYRAPVNDAINGVSYLYPGKYDTLPPQEATQNVIFMFPGNYCVYDVVRVTNSTREMRGEDVFLYIKYSSKPAPLSIQGGTMIVDAPDDGDYQGYLMYVEPPAIINGAYYGASKTCKINGGSSDFYTGTIFAPYCDVEITGGGNPTGLSAQLVAYTIHLNGNNALLFKYVPGQLAINEPEVGLMR